MKKLGLLLISTGKYDQFVQPLVKSVDQYFFPDNKVEIYLFTDKNVPLKHSDRINVLQIPIQHKPWPASTLYRYKYFSDEAHLIDCDYVFYCDVDMLFVDTVNERDLQLLMDLLELPNPDNRLSGLIACRHVGFKDGGWGSTNVDKRSTAYVSPDNWDCYLAGGFQGGETKAYLQACKILAENIETDERNGVLAEWHDESHWNAYWKNNIFMGLILSGTFFVAETMERAPDTKLIALDKDHAAIRC